MTPDGNRRWIVPPDGRVLVTGANGFIGTRVVKSLLERGMTNIVCFVRPSGSLTRLNEVLHQQGATTSVAIVRGNLLDPSDCRTAMAGVSVVFHLAAGIDKSYAGCFMNSVLTTRNLLDVAVADRTLKRFVNVSSFSVYSNLQMRRGSLFDESTTLETEHEQRNDPYGYGKLKQEEIVRRYHERFGIPYVILRPGAVWGPGKVSMSGRIGIDTFGVFLHLGGSNRIPMTYVDNCADAIVHAGLVEGANGEVFNVVDDELPTSRQFLRLYKHHVRRFASIAIPYPAAYLLSAMWERYSRWSEGQLPPRFNRRRASADWKRHRYSNEKLKRFGWRPRVSFSEASREYFAAVGGPS